MNNFSSTSLSVCFMEAMEGRKGKQVKILKCHQRGNDFETHGYRECEGEW